MNPIEMLKGLMQNGGNPQQMALKFIKQSSPSNPMINNLMELANKGDSRGVENFARNLFKEKRNGF